MGNTVLLCLLIYPKLLTQFQRHYTCWKTLWQDTVYWCCRSIIWCLRVQNCVPQGSILGPLLFTLDINYICASLEQCKVHFYADDTILYASAPTVQQALSNLQCAFNCMQKYLNSHTQNSNTWGNDIRESFDTLVVSGGASLREDELKLILNESKTKFILFSKPRKPVPTIHKIQSLHGTEIEGVSQ